MRDKLMVRVIHAMREGASFSDEIAEMLRVSIPVASSILTELEKAGLVRKNGRSRMLNGRGPRSLGRELVNDAR